MMNQMQGDRTKLSFQPVEHIGNRRQRRRDFLHHARPIGKVFNARIVFEQAVQLAAADNQVRFGRGQLLGDIALK